ncbi:MAG TPA: hypothetical protein VGG99_30000 [Acetobacteraceae bacterium]|jgi:hypothetical protein
MAENNTVGTPAQNEVVIVEALPMIELPESVNGESTIKILLSDIIAAQAAVADSGARLDSARQEKKAGNVIGNWLHNRDEKVQDAHLNLNRSIGHLTQKSSLLLVFNTAISKYLTVQQRTLLEQQELLKRQAGKIEDQNAEILVRQKLLEKQLREINAANRGLMEAKGISQEQAQALVGCVKRVSEAESRMEIAGKELTATVGLKFEEAVGECIGRLNEGFGILEAHHEDLRREVNDAISEHACSTKTQFDRLSNINATLVADMDQRLQAHLDEALRWAASQDAAAKQLRHDLTSWLATEQQDLSAALDIRLQTLHQLVDDIDAKCISGRLVQEKVLIEQSTALRDCRAQVACLEADHFKATRQSRVFLVGLAVMVFAALGFQIVRYLGF